MSEVYHAIDPVENRAAAVKLLSPAFAHDERACAMARREPWVMRQVRHPSVPLLYDHGETLLREGVVVPCTVMELLRGSMLTERLAIGPLAWYEAVQAVATISDAVAVAHRRGIVHRDLTPGNLMLTDRGIKIIDFCLAGTVAAGKGPANRSHLAKQTSQLDRFPPAQGDPADDVYSLGVLLYQLLTAKSPYLSATTTDYSVAPRLRHAAPTPILNVPGMPREVADICRDCMAKRPDDRPDSVAVSLALWATLLPRN
jgi:serine/threonine-protein kinase